MRRKIKKSLPAKVFLCIFGLLTLSSLVIYLVSMAVIPQRYTLIATDKVADEITELVDTLASTEYDQALDVLQQFCIQHRAQITLSDGLNTLTISYLEESDSSQVASSVAEVTFPDQAATYLLNIIAPISAQGELTAVFLRLLPLIFLLILAISFFGAWLCHRILVTPVLQISRISQRMAAADLTWRCQLDRTDELGMLAGSLNSMAARLSQAMGELEDANAALQSDIDAAKHLERQRQDFFTAVSHELKTPITALKGQLESMLLGIGDYQNHDKYLPQALGTVEEMERLVREILRLSKLEAVGLPEDRETVSLEELLEICISTLQPLAEEKEITIDTAGLSDQPIYVHRQLFQKALSNLIGNAVRYSPPRAKVVIKTDRGLLHIQNTGVTIDETDLPDLFTPFYRSEKSRNRQTGGSGLGLYIVKTILELHSMGYQLHNQGDSVVFTIHFNQNEMKP